MAEPADHGQTTLCEGEFGAVDRFAGTCTLGSTRRGGSGSRDAVVAGGLDERGDRLSLWGDGGLGAALAQLVCDGGVEGLRAAVVAGPSGERGLRALSIAAAILSEPVENRPNWTIPRLRAEIARRGGPPISTSRLSILLREKGGSAGAGPATA